MKIVAATKQTYGPTKYIVELTSKELLGVMCLGHYSKIAINREGESLSEDRDSLESGDVITETLIEESAEKIRSLRTDIAKIKESFIDLRESIDGVEKIIKPH